MTALIGYENLLIWRQWVRLLNEIDRFELLIWVTDWKGYGSEALKKLKCYEHTLNTTG